MEKEEEKFKDNVCEEKQEQINQNKETKEHECKCHKNGNCCKDKDSESEQDEVTEFEESEEVLILKNNIETLEEKLKASHAELINYRKRKDDEVANKLKFANQDIILDILPILDNFDRAIKLQKSDDNNLSKFLDGFKMLYNSLNETLKRYGVEEIDCLGKEFDPNYHEAMLVEKDESKENNIILEVLIKGYILKGRVIRPASVKVNKID